MTATKVKKFFTVEQAGSTLPLVRMIVADIMRQSAAVKVRQDLLSRIRRSRKSERNSDQFYTEEVSQIEQEVEKEISLLQGFIEELGRLGVEVRDTQLGRIEFPAMMGDREISLCWQVDDPTVEYFRELDGDFAERRKLLDADPGDAESSAAASPGNDPA